MESMGNNYAWIMHSDHSVLKVEYVHRHTFATRAKARLKTVCRSETHRCCSE
jgi:hypothetical protein